MANKWVYMFSEGNMTMRNLLGGKGANLAEMTTIGLPVPQGFHGGEQLVGTVQRAAARGHGIGILLKRHDAKLLSGSDQRQVKFSWGGVRSAASIRTFHNMIDKDSTLKA